MDMCKEASTDKWRLCLNDCHVGLDNEARKMKLGGMPATASNRIGDIRWAVALVVAGIGLATVSVIMLKIKH
jgi:hypothetical protein